MDELETLAARHNVSLDAANHLRDALARGHGEMAQFNHPALGGMGQWHRGGMLMIGDMFNDDLKARVGAFLRDLAAHMPEASADSGAAQDASSGTNAWPKEFGAPSSSGSQNDARYAFFADARRLVIVGGESAGTYDTGDVRISGVSQQQGRSSDLAFTSQNGPVRLSDLKRVEAPHAAPRDTGLSEPGQSAPQSSGASSPGERTAASGAHSAANHRDDFTTLERLSELHAKQILTDDEYRTKKAEILARF